MNNLLKSPDSEEGHFMQYSCYLQLDLSLISWSIASLIPSIIQYIFIIIDGFFIWTCIKEALRYSNNYDINQQRLVIIGVLTTIAYILSMSLSWNFPVYAIIIFAMLFSYGLYKLSRIIAHSKNNSKDSQFINHYFKSLREYVQHDSYNTRRHN